MNRHLISAVAAVVLCNPVFAQPPVEGHAPVPEDVLAESRGKFLLPNGVEVAMAVQTDTSVDGQLLLRSVFTVDQGAPRLAIYAPQSTRQSGAPGTSGPSQHAGNPGDVWVSFDRESGVSLVERSYRPSVGAVTVSTGEQAEIGLSPDGSTPLPLGPGDRAQTQNGTVGLDRLGSGFKVTLSQQDLEVSHVFGLALGSVLLNSGNNRAIETSTTINLDLMNATPATVGSAMPRIDSMALDATRDLIR
ncbi:MULTISPECIES: hypothetical protein [unclassified Sphingobium]|uniref:hypothetical protein n=1 Tax=unclassified Sphingobium TaxID=2611147 RepID=UPI0022245152|nr:MULTISPECIES: hypothetical protein [unclassified Sphingobium]MCW2380664.1 hypothetical protein [Sphingobium sp. B2D3B]MCW2399228.1 hypothetical protein [Sphingobium sp. B2D3C]